MKKLTIAIYPIVWQMYFTMEKEEKWIPRSFKSSHGILPTKSKLFGLLGPHFATIAKFQWFSKAPSPLNGMVWDNHWIQWFFDGLWVRQPLVLMVFDGCPPLVQQWNGYIPSLKSTPNIRGGAVCKYSTSLSSDGKSETWLGFICNICLIVVQQALAHLTNKERANDDQMYLFFWQKVEKTEIWGLKFTYFWEETELNWNLENGDGNWQMDEGWSNVGVHNFFCTNLDTDCIC